MTFVESDLRVDISKDELDGIAHTLVEMGDPDPINTTITEQLQKLEDYTRRWNVPDDRAKRLVRALVLFELYTRLGTIPDKRQTKYDEAMKELREIRDGKFPDLALEEPPPAGLPSSQGKWGSKDPIL